MNGNMEILVKKYPRTITLLLAASEDTDVDWAVGVISSVKQRESEVARELIDQAFKKRQGLKSKEARQAVEKVLRVA